MVLRSPEHSEQLCGKYFYWFQRYDVTEGRGGGMQESWTRQHAATRASLHVYHWTRVCGGLGAAGGSGGDE